MLKKIAIGVALVAVLAWGLYAFAGFRVAVDGSGISMMPAHRRIKRKYLI